MLSGEIFPSFLTKETSQSELLNASRRHEISEELAQFFTKKAGLTMDQDGMIKLDFKDELERYAASKVDTYDLKNSVLQDD